MFRYLPRKMNGVFAIDKPSGITSAKFLGKLQSIFTNSDNFSQDLNEAKSKAYHNLKSNKQWSKAKIDSKVATTKVKIGHGGTLDPLASGILIVGVGTGTKKLQDYLNNSTKTYETKALLGISTTTGDSEGEILTRNPIEHITKDMVRSIPEKFVGDLQQTPPIFSALKLNGKPLHEYAREGIPLPEPIKSRKVKVNQFDLFEEDLLTTDHEYITLTSELDENGKPLETLLANNPTLNDSPLYFSDQYLEKHPNEKNPPKPINLDQDEKLPEKLPLIHFSASVSSGTYIRSLVSDVGRALQSSAYMVMLIRTKQGEWEIGKNVFTLQDFTDRDQRIWGPVLKKVLDNGAKVNVNEELARLSSKIEPLIEKEKQVLAKYQGTDNQPNDETTKKEIVDTNDETPKDEHKDHETNKELELIMKDEIKEGVEVTEKESTTETESKELPKKRTIDEVEK